MSTLAYVASSSLVYVIDTITNTVIDAIATEAYPTDIAITPNGNLVYVTNNVANVVSVINTSKNTVIATVPVGDSPKGLAITPDGRFVYVANTFSNNVSVINTSSNTVIATIPVGGGPEDIAITPNNNFAYVTNTFSDTVSVIETSTNTVVNTIAVGDQPVSIVIAPYGNAAYVGMQNYSGVIRENVTVIDTNTNQVVGMIPLDNYPSDLAITPNGRFVYVTKGAANAVDIIYTGSDTVVDTVTVGNTPRGVAITPDGKFAYVANTGSSNISVIETTTNTVVDTIPVYVPLAIAIGNVVKQGVSLVVRMIEFAGSVQLGEKITYSIPITNNGTDAATEVILRDILPQGVKFISASAPQGTCSELGGVVTCKLGTIEAGETVIVKITVKTQATGIICNRVLIASNETDIVLAIQCNTVFKAVCIEVTSILDSCEQEVEKKKIFKLPTWFRKGNISCEVKNTSCEVLHVAKTEMPDYAEATVRINVSLELLINNHLCSNVLEKEFCFDKTVTLYAPLDAEIECNIKNITCECNDQGHSRKITYEGIYNKEICCAIKMTLGVQSKKLAQLEIPLLNSCEPRLCD